MLWGRGNIKTKDPMTAKNLASSSGHSREVTSLETKVDPNESKLSGLQFPFYKIRN